MRRTAAMMSMLMLGAAAVAQVPPGAPPTRPAHRGGGREQLFIAPSGEPFRADEGEPYPVAAWFAQADRNHDGRVSEAEFTLDFERMFATLDADHDGVLRSEEIQHYENDVLPELHGFGEGGGRFGDGGFSRGGRRGGGRRGGEEGGAGGEDGEAPASSDVGKSPEIEGDLRSGLGAGRYELIDISEPVTSMDSDFNGVVSRDEMLRAAHRRFALLDPQGRGWIALADLPRTVAQGRPGGGGDEHARHRQRR